MSQPLKHAEYARLLDAAILNLRMRIRYGENVSQEEVHDLMDSLHNIPKMLLGHGGWHTPEHIDSDLERYDSKWQRPDDSSRIRLKVTLSEIRAGKCDVTTAEVNDATR